VRAEVARLQARADSLATDSAALERIAREYYGLIRDGERLYRFVEPDSVPAQR
jgi:cell division protein FtsB